MSDCRRVRFRFRSGGRNLTDRDYDTFYFKSVSRSFFSKGRPISFGIKLNVNI